MKKLIDNKHIVHIVAEIVVLIGLVFYFSSKNNRLVSYIEELTLRVEEQEDIINKHGSMITQLTNMVHAMQMGSLTQQLYKEQFVDTSEKSVQPQKQSSKKPKKVSVKQVKPLSGSSKITESFVSEIKTLPKKVRFEVENENENENEGSDSDLDDEIAEELSELEHEEKEIVEELSELAHEENENDILEQEHEQSIDLKKN